MLALLEPLVFHDEALDDELAEGFGGPDAELGGLVAVDPVADSDDGVEVVVLHLPDNLPVAFGANYFHFGNSCLPLQLTRLEDVLKVLVNCGHINPKQLRQGLLCQPDGLVFDEDVHFHRAIRRGVEQELIRGAHWGKS